MAFNVDKAVLLALKINKLNKELKEVKKEYRALFNDVCEHDLESGIETFDTYYQRNVNRKWERCKICGLVWKYGESLPGTFANGGSRESREYKYLDKETTSFTFFLNHGEVAMDFNDIRRMVKEEGYGAALFYAEVDFLPGNNTLMAVMPKRGHGVQWTRDVMPAMHRYVRSLGHSPRVLVGVDAQSDEEIFRRLDLNDFGEQWVVFVRKDGKGVFVSVLSGG